MNDVIAPKWSSLTPGLVEVAMFWKVNMSLILNNPTDFGESPIWNTLIPFRRELPDDIDDSDDNENEKDDEEEEEDLSLQYCLSKVKKPTVRVGFKPFNFLVQQHENIKPNESNTTKYTLFGFV
jgi:hypothetical protein